MIGQVLSVFANVVAPVFAILGLGWFAGPRLDLEARTLSRIVYYVFIPAFTFDVMSRSRVPVSSALRMAAYISAAHLAFGALGWLVARALGRSREMRSAYVMLCVFANMGNFGLALVQFRLGEAALVPATVYFVATLVVSFSVCVGVAAWTRGGSVPSALRSVLTTPALLALLPALAISAARIELPPFVSRTVGLLGGAMIPTMLFLLGLQLARTERVRVSGDVLAVAGIRLLLAPAVAALIAGLFGVAGVERAAGVLQSAMPPAVLVSIVAIEYDIAPTFVTTAIFFATLWSLPTLTVLLAFL